MNKFIIHPSTFILLIALLAGCATPPTSTLQHSVANRLRPTLNDYPGARDYLIHVTLTLEGLAATEKNLSPEFVWNAVSALPVETTGQFAAIAASEARITVTQVLSWYKTADRKTLAQIAAGFRYAIAQP